MKLPEHIIISGEAIPFEEYCKRKAEAANAKYHDREITYTPQMVAQLAQLCQTDQELDEDQNPQSTFELMEGVCIEIEATHAYLREHKELPKQPIDSVVELEVVQEQSSEISVVDAAKDVNAHTLLDLENKFDFGPGTYVKVREGQTATPQDYAKILGVGYKMANRGIWMVGEAINYLRSIGMDNEVDQIGADLQMSRSALYNWGSTCLRLPPSLREGITPSTAIEICTARFSKDEAKNKEVIEGLIKQAREEKWNPSEARSFVLAKKEELGRPRTSRAGRGDSVEREAIREAVDIMKECAETLPNVAEGQSDDLESKIAVWLNKYAQLGELT